MSMMDSFIPKTGETADNGIAAADVGPGGPEPIAGYGVAGEEPDVSAEAQRSRPLNDLEKAVDAHRGDDPPFRTPEVD